MEAVETAAVVGPHTNSLTITKTYADNSTVTYTYTPDNLPLRTTYASGRWKENVYDAQRRLCGVIYSSPDMDCDLHLDEYGRTTFASNGVAQTCYALNDAGGATNETWATDNAIDTISHTFDGAERLTGLAITGQGYAQYLDYSTNGLLSSISNSDAVVAYNYSPDLKDVGYTMAFADGGTFVSVAVRDPYRRDLVLSIANSCGGNMHTLEYSYDALSRPISRNADTFGYNARSEVSSANIGGNSETHEYDGIGNATIAVFNSETNTYSANNLNQYTTILRDSPPPREILHDADGNMTQCGDWSFTYDADNRLTSVSSNGIILIINQYDHKGRRVRKTTPTSETTFLYDGWNLIEEREIAGTVTNETYYYWGKDLSGTLQGAGGVGGLLYVKHNDAIYVPHADAMGNILRYTDTAGNVVAAYTYDAFGKTISATGTMATVFHHRFSTKYYDKETGLYYYGYRFYLPSLMRWLNRDPIEERGGETLYAFCRNNCIDGIDVLGCLIVRVHRFGEDPPRGWENPQNIGETHTTFRVPSVRPFACAKGKWGFKVTFEPNTTTVDIYYKESVSLDTIKDESEHLKLAREYDEALDVFKAAVEAICDCPAKAKRLYNEANGKLQEARSMYEFINGWLESPGGPHGH